MAGGMRTQRRSQLGGKRRMSRKAMRTKKAKRATKSKGTKKTKRTKRAKGTKKKGKKKMNAYMKALDKARKADAESFEYNGKTYYQKTTKTGMKIYASKK